MNIKDKDTDKKIICDLMKPTFEQAFHVQYVF